MGMMFVLASLNTTPPATPVNLVFTEQCEEGGINCYDELDWDNVTDAVKYYLYKDGVYYDETTNSQYNFTGVVARTGCWSVSAVSASNVEGSESVCVSWVPDAPTSPIAGLFVVNEEPGFPQLELGWDWSTDIGIDGYEVWRSLTYSGVWAFLANSLGNNYTDSAVSANTTYFYQVRAYNAGGEGPFSLIVSATATN